MKFGHIYIIDAFTDHGRLLNVQSCLTVCTGTCFGRFDNVAPLMVTT
jgi:hypothetical protein